MQINQGHIVYIFLIKCITLKTYTYSTDDKVFSMAVCRWLKRSSSNGTATKDSAESDIMPLLSLMSRAPISIAYSCWYVEDYWHKGQSRYSRKFSRGVKFFADISNLYHFIGLISLMHVIVHAHYTYTLHSRAYFKGLIFADNSLFIKTRTRENFPLYSINIVRNRIPGHNRDKEGNK